MTRTKVTPTRSSATRPATRAKYGRPVVPPPRRSWQSRFGMPLLWAAVGSLLTVVVLLVTGGVGHTPRQHGGSAAAAGGTGNTAYDPDATRHVYEKTNTGGVETLTVLDPADRKNLDLVQTYLREAPAKFRQGDFYDPAMNHAASVPGLQGLIDGASRVDVRYEELADGGRLVYSTTEPALVSALQQWMDRVSGQR